MKNAAIAVILAVSVAGCSPEAAETAQPATNILDLEVQGMAFTGPDTIKSGWTTIRVVSDGITGEATMYLGPGNYLVECYVKTNGVQHNYNPVPGELGMVFPLTVLDEEGGMAEPEANVTLTLTNRGYEISDGSFKPGDNSVRVRFAEQQLYNNFVGHDAHVFRIEEDTDVGAATRWPDFFPIDGQQTPAPARFVGGIHDMPQGATGYFKLALEPGDYGITAEIPDAEEKGFFKRFSVSDR